MALAFAWGLGWVGLGRVGFTSGAWIEYGWLGLVLSGCWIVWSEYVLFCLGRKGFEGAKGVVVEWRRGWCLGSTMEEEEEQGSTLTDGHTVLARNMAKIPHNENGK